MIEVWDGKSRTRKSDKYAAPDAGDWQQITKEVIEIQKVLIKNNNVYSNISGDTILIGQPLILESNIQLAKPLNPEVIGISIVNCDVDENCIYITQGRLSLKDWSYITGTDELVPGAYYYLSPSVEGKLTLTPPSIIGEIIVQIGRAQDKNTLAINIQTPIYL